MTVDEAKEILISRGVNHYDYSFGKEHRSTDCLVLEKRGSDWVIYNWERGREGAVKIYSNEDIAARSFVDDVLWSASMSPWKPAD